MRVHLALIRSLAIVFCVMLLATACQDDEADEVAEQIDGDAIGSPTAAPGLEEDIEEVSIEVDDGQMAQDEIELTEERPTILHVTNHDDDAYLLRIDPLVNETMIPAGDMVSIEFTTPGAASYTGELLPEAGGEPLDSIAVEVTNAAGIPD